MVTESILNSKFFVIPLEIFVHLHVLSFKLSHLFHVRIQFSSLMFIRLNETCMHCMLFIEPTCSGNMDKKFFSIAVDACYRQIYFMGCGIVDAEKMNKFVFGFCVALLINSSQKDDKYSIEFRFYAIFVIHSTYHHETLTNSTYL